MSPSGWIALGLINLAIVLLTVLDTDRLVYGPPRRRGGPSPATPPARGDDAPPTTPPRRSGPCSS